LKFEAILDASGLRTVKTPKSTRPSVGHCKVANRHQEKPDSWKGKETTPASDEFMKEARKESNLLIQKINATLGFFCCFNHLLQL